MNDSRYFSLIDKHQHGGSGRQDGIDQEGTTKLKVCSPLVRPEPVHCFVLCYVY